MDWEVTSGIATWDQTWSELFKLPPGKQSGTAGIWEQAIHPDDFPEVMEELNNHLSGKSPHFIAKYRLAGCPGREYSIRTCGVALARNILSRPTQVRFVSQKILFTGY